LILHDPNPTTCGGMSTLPHQYTIMHDSSHGSKMFSLCLTHLASSVSGTTTTIPLTLRLCGRIGILKVVMISRLCWSPIIPSRDQGVHITTQGIDGWFSTIPHVHRLSSSARFAVGYDWWRNHYRLVHISFR